MPVQRPKNTTAVYLDLPSELVERVRDYATRDLRPLRTVYILALEEFLAKRGGPVHPTVPPSNQATLSSTDTVGTTAKGPKHELAAATEEERQAFLGKLETEEERSIARLIWGGRTEEEIAAELKRGRVSIRGKIHRIQRKFAKEYRT